MRRGAKGHALFPYLRARGFLSLGRCAIRVWTIFYLSCPQLKKKTPANMSVLPPTLRPAVPTTARTQP